MNEEQLDCFIKALVDGLSAPEELAKRAGVEPAVLAPLQDEIDRAASLIRGFHHFADEGMKPVGLPPPPNPYLAPARLMDEQSPEYFAFEALMRGTPTLDRCLFTCTQLGLDENTARAAIETVSTPWREANGWRSYAKLTASGRYVLMNKAPVKLQRPLARLRERCAALLEK